MTAANEVRTDDVNVTLAFEGGKPADFKVPGHDSRLGQVVSNLIDNARSFSPPGGTVRITCRRLQERGRDRGRRRRSRHPPGSLGKDLRALLHRPPAPGLRAEFRPRPVDLQADRRSPWRQHPGREPHQRRRRRRRAARARRPLRGAAAGDVMAADAATIHASAVLIGPKAALIRGPGRLRQIAAGLGSAAGGGARRPALRAAGRRRPRPCRGHAGRLLVRPAPALAGLIEIRGLGIRRLPYEPVAAVGLVVDLAADGCRPAPGPAGRKAGIEGVTLPRLAVAAGMPALPMVLAFLKHPRPAIDLRPASGLTPAPAVRLKKLTITGLGSPPPKTDTSSPLWPHLFAVQQSAYIAKQALATGLRMGLNARPFVRRNVAPARSSG